MDTNDRILLNMAINNTERKLTGLDDIPVHKFEQMVEQRFKVYKRIHKEMEK